VNATQAAIRAGKKLKSAKTKPAVKQKPVKKKPNLNDDLAVRVCACWCACRCDVWCVRVRACVCECACVFVFVWCVCDHPLALSLTPLLFLARPWPTAHDHLVSSRLVTPPQATLARRAQSMRGEAPKSKKKPPPKKVRSLL
jgi:hypothetical protein